MGCVKKDLRSSANPVSMTTAKRGGHNRRLSSLSKTEELVLHARFAIRRVRVIETHNHANFSEKKKNTIELCLSNTTLFKTSNSRKRREH